MWILALANVVLVTWDGVAREDFLDARRLPKFWSRRADGGLIVGGLSGPEMGIAVRPVSLPAYHSIFTGGPTSCAGNGCGRVDAETFPERLVRELSLPRTSVAAFASWARIADAVEHAPGTITVDAGPDGTSPPPPWLEARRDADTFARALRYLVERRPRFLYISLGDADQWGHRGDLARYRATLSLYDEWLDILLRRLKTLGAYTVVVTTDHGRGAGERWTGHDDAHARSIWLFAQGPGVKAGSAKRPATHLDIRPTIEALFGLCSVRAPIEEIAVRACGPR